MLLVLLFDANIDALFVVGADDVAIGISYELLMLKLGAELNDIDCAALLLFGVLLIIDELNEKSMPIPAAADDDDFGVVAPSIGMPLLPMVFGLSNP